MSEFTNSFVGTGPLGTSPANELDAFIRTDVKASLLERMALEHHPLDSAAIGADDKDSPNAQGRHIAGLIGAILVGTTAEINAVVSGGNLPGKGAMVFNTDTGYLRYYHPTNGWTNLPAIANPLVVATGGGLKLTGEANAIGVAEEVPVPGVAYSIPYTLTYGANIIVDASKSNVFHLTLTGNGVLSNPSNLKEGCNYIFIIKQDATGNRTLAYGNAYTFAESLAPVLSTAANAVDILSCIYDGTKLRCTMINNFG